MRVRVVITGASGMLGSTLALHLSEAGHEVVALNRSTRLHARFESHLLDLTTPTAADSLAALEPDAIVHTAALTDVDACERDPHAARAANVDATTAVAQAAARMGSRLIHISTDSVFAGDKPLHSESEPPRPLNVYAATKLEAEQVALGASENAVVVRTNIFGWSPSGRRSLAEWVLSRLREGWPVPGFIDSWFTPILTDDLAENIEMLLASPATGVLHVAGADRVSKFEFARMLADAFGLDAGLVSGSSMADASFSAARPADMSIDCSKASALGLRIPHLPEALIRLRTLEEQGRREQLAALVTKGV